MLTGLFRPLPNPHERSVLWVKYSKEIGVLWSCQTRPYTVSIYTATVEQSEFKYRCWVWILFFIWNAWIIERERRWGGIHSGDGWSRHRFPPYVSGLLGVLQCTLCMWVQYEFWKVFAQKIAHLCVDLRVQSVLGCCERHYMTEEDFLFPSFTHMFRLRLIKSMSDL